MIQQLRSLRDDAMRMDIHSLDSLATNDDLAAARRMRMPRTAARTSTGVNLTVSPTVGGGFSLCAPKPGLVAA